MTQDVFKRLNTTPAALLQRQRVELPGVENARQLGGYVCENGRRVRQNLLFRTGGLSSIPIETVRLLSKDYDIRAIADLRIPEEAEYSPDKKVPGAQYVNIELMNNGSTPKSREAARLVRAAGDEIDNLVQYARSGVLSTLYTNIMMSRTGQRGLSMFFRLLLVCGEVGAQCPENSDGAGVAMLWHSYYGKDRAGVATALLLYALGADDDTVMADFLLSNEARKESIENLRIALKQQGCSEQEQNEAEAIAGVKGEYLQAAFDAVRERYGSIHTYLWHIGVNSRDIRKIREYYLESR